MLITAGPGMGKSTLAAKICQNEDLGCLAGCHFFQSRNSTRNNPRLMLQSIAKQMCDTVPGYRKALKRKLQTNLGNDISQLNCEELLTVLFEESLCNVEKPNSNLVVVLDALDECSMEPNDDLLKALSTKLPRFPSWLRFVFTSRPLRNTSGALQSTVGVEIEPNDKANIKDLELYFSFELKACYPQYDGDNVNLGKKLVKMTKGLFLVASFVIEYLKRENVASPEKILELFPNRISSVYENYFSRLKEVLLPYISQEEGFYKMLEAVVATNNSLPKDIFYNILCLKSEREVSRQERKGRRDALDTLHCFFPVAENHVTAFHKSVTDWLTLQDDEEHDFSVRVEDGDKVLASQCNDVLSEKDLDKPLSLTDNEEYAVRCLAFLSRKDSSFVKLADRMSLNICVLTALSFKTNFQEDRNEIIPLSLLEILRGVKYWSDTTIHHRSCRLYRPLSFGCYLALVLQAVHAKGVSAELTAPKPLDVLKKHPLPYFDKNILVKPSYKGCLLKRCKDGFIAVLYIPYSNSLSTAVYRFQLDGCLIKQKCFPYETRIATSPNINFIVAAQKGQKRIKILDVTTLEVVREYKFSHDAIDTCHVFGDDRNFFIVIKGCHDNKVYVIEGLTGRVRNTITVAEGSKVMGVSCLGHIVVSRTTADGSATPYRETFLYPHDRREHVPIPRPPVIGNCICVLVDMLKFVEALNISEDGRLLAFHYTDTISVVNTSDGSLFKQWPLQRWSRNLAILFVSKAYLVISFGKIMLVINFQTDEIEHRFYLPYEVDFTYINQYLLLPEQDGKSFNLISSLYDFGSYRSPKVSRLVFHNLNLQGLQ